jgi:hypothetical protein
MTSHTGRRPRDRELLKAIKTQNRLYYALQSLFELLENYGPRWYTKQCHDKAETALKEGANSMRQFREREIRPYPADSA